jgi:hypothetical protein
MPPLLKFLPTPARELTPQEHGLYLVAGVLLPGGILALLASDTPSGLWQSGELHDYTVLVLTGSASLVFWPFVALAMACFAVALFKPLASRHLLVRLGIYSGVVLALHYWLLWGVVLFDVKSLWTASGIFTVAVITPLIGCLAIALPLAFSWAWWQLFVHEGPHVGKWWWTLLMIAALPVLATAPFWMLMIPVIMFYSSPHWAFAAYFSLAMRLERWQRRKYQATLRELLAGMTWLAAYLAAWRFAVQQALEQYSRLPLSKPGDCYVATAAAHGHSRLVGSWSAACGDGSIRRMNRQLLWLKCGEIALRTASPALHRGLRRVYDRWGPWLARSLQNPWLADVAYLSLKPIEWSTRIMLLLLLPEARRFMAQTTSADGPAGCSGDHRSLDC